MSGDDELRIELRTRGSQRQVGVVGEVDLHSAPDLAEAIASAIDSAIDSASTTDGATRSVDLDLAGVTFIDSSGVRVLIDGRSQAADRGLELHIVDSSPVVARLLDVTGLRELFGLG